MPNKIALFSAVGPELTRYEVDVDGAALTARESIMLPANIHYVVPHGARVPATPYQLDPVTAAFNIGALIRWLDYNDAFNGETVVHPSDCFGGILAAADWASRTRVAAGKAPILKSMLIFQMFPPVLSLVAIYALFDQLGQYVSWLGINSHGAVIVASLGGMAATPRRAAGCEAALRGLEWHRDTALDAALAALATDYTPLTDLRATAQYRQLVAGNLLRRFLLETTVTSATAGAVANAADGAQPVLSLYRWNEVSA